MAFRELINSAPTAKSSRDHEMLEIRPRNSGVIIYGSRLSARGGL